MTNTWTMMNTWKRTLARGLIAAALCAAPLAAGAAPTSDLPGSTLPAQMAQAQPAAPAAVPTAPAGQGTHEAPHGAPHGAAHGGLPADEHGSHFPPFDAKTFASQLLWLIFSFGLLYYLMSKIALPRIGRILEERHDRIADDLEEAAKHRAESQAAQLAYEKALTEARAKANGIAGETRNRLTADADANRKALEADLSQKLADAEARISATKSEALTHVRGIAVDATHTIVTTLLGTAPGAPEVEKAVDGVLSKRTPA